MDNKDYDKNKYNSENVIFTSGATESNNLILKGLVYKALENKSKRTKKRAGFAWCYWVRKNLYNG